MRCPYCRTRLTETAEECPACRLTLDRASKLLGPVPRLEHGVADMAGVLARGEAAKLHKAINRLGGSFPQLKFHVLLHLFPEEHPFELHVFWLFNRGNYSSEAHKGGNNHSLLLAIDPARGRSALMTGYGLEPFLGDEALDHLLELAEPAWIAGHWAQGIHEVIRGLDRLLASAAREAAAGFGLPSPANPRRPGEF